MLACMQTFALSQICVDTHTHIHLGALITAEPLLRDTMQKDAPASKSIKDEVQESERGMAAHFADLCEAFSHYTFKESERQMVRASERESESERERVKNRQTDRQIDTHTLSLSLSHTHTHTHTHSHTYSHFGATYIAPSSPLIHKSPCGSEIYVPVRRSMPCTRAQPHNAGNLRHQGVRNRRNRPALQPEDTVRGPDAALGQRARGRRPRRRGRLLRCRRRSGRSASVFRATYVL